MSDNLTIKELCKRWGVHRITLAKWRMNKKGPAYIKVGRKVFYPLTAVEAYEAQNLREAGA